MNLYKEEHTIFRESFRKFVEKEMLPYVEEWEEKREMPRAIWKKMGREGYLCPWVDEAYGGSGAGFEYSVIIGEELAMAGVGLGIMAHADIIAAYIAYHGNPWQKENWLPGCVSGD